MWNCPRIAVQSRATENLFNLASVDPLSPQSRQPLLFTMNCLNGYFHFPYHNSLSEELLKAEGKGIIAAFSPTGLSLAAPAHRFHKVLLDQLVNRNHERLGDAILAGQAGHSDSGTLPELLSIYHLLGDPVLRIRARGFARLGTSNPPPALSVGGEKVLAGGQGKPQER